MLSRSRARACAPMTGRYRAGRPPRRGLGASHASPIPTTAATTSGVELAACALVQLVDGGVEAERLPVGPLGDHRVEGVGGRDHARGEWNLLVPEPVRVAGAVEALVVVAHDGPHLPRAFRRFAPGCARLERVAPRASRSRAKIAIRPRRGGTSSDAMARSLRRRPRGARPAPGGRRRCRSRPTRSQPREPASSIPLRGGRRTRRNRTAPLTGEADSESG